MSGPGSSKGSFARGKSDGRGWRLGLGRGGVGGGVWRGRVHKGPRQAAGADACAPALCTARWGGKAENELLTLSGTSAGWEWQALPWWLQGSAWAAWAPSSSRAAPATTNTPTRTKPPDDEVWRGTVGTGPVEKTSFGRVAGCSVSWRSLEGDGGACPRICTRWTRRLQSADVAGRQGGQGIKPIQLHLHVRRGGISNTVIGRQRRRQGAGGGRGVDGREEDGEGGSRGGEYTVTSIEIVEIRV